MTRTSSTLFHFSRKYCILFSGKNLNMHLDFLIALKDVGVVYFTLVPFFVFIVLQVLIRWCRIEGGC